MFKLIRKSITAISIVGTLFVPSLSLASSITNVSIEGDYYYEEAEVIDAGGISPDYLKDPIVIENILRSRYSSDPFIGDHISLFGNKSITQEINFNYDLYVETASEISLNNLNLNYANLFNSNTPTTLKGTLNQQSISIRTLNLSEVYEASTITEVLNNLSQPNSNPVIDFSSIFNPLTQDRGIDVDQWWTQVLTDYYNFDELAQLSGTDRATFQEQFLSYQETVSFEELIDPRYTEAFSIYSITQDANSLVTLTLSDGLAIASSKIRAALFDFLYFSPYAESFGVHPNDLYDLIPRDIYLSAFRPGAIIEYNEQQIFVEPEIGIFEVTGEREITFQGVSVPEPSSAFSLIFLGLILLVKSQLNKG